MPDHIARSPDRHSRVAAPRPAPATGVEVRRLHTTKEYLACVELQKSTWGEEFSELVPLAILKVAQRIGGITAGAFGDDGRLLGFVFGMTGIEDGRLVHWSDMLAVRAEARNLGIGRRLKEFQRESLLRIDVERVYWTFDPLVSRNAHLNLNRLGARVVEYTPDMYGNNTDSSLHRGLGTDRFVVVWEIASEASAARSPVQLSAVRSTPIVNSAMGDGDTPIGIGPAPATAAVVRVQIPMDIQAIQASSLEVAARWRETTRQAFLWYLERGYRVTGFYSNHPAGPGYYVLGSGAAQSLRGLSKKGSED